MPTPFSALENRINVVAHAKLANATAVIAGQPVDGILDNAFVEQQGVEGTRPTFAAPDAALSAVTHSTAVSINSVPYRVIGIQPNTGVTVLILERA